MLQHDEFIDLVAKMRKYQNEYFATRTQVAYNTARSLERKVDAALAEYKNQKP